MKKISHKLFFTLIIIILYTPIVSSQADAPLKEIDGKRVSEIMQILSENPKGLGKQYSDRTFWDRLLKSGKYDTFLSRMKNAAFPAFSENDYFSLSRGASSSAKGLEMMRERARGLSRLVWAECLENKGAYMSDIESGLKSIINQKSWVSPRNDFNFVNYNGKEYTVELTSALYAHTVAQTLYLLEDKITPQLRKKVIEALYKRVFNPTLETIANYDKDSYNKFLTMTNNYNAVCLSGVVGAALTVIEDKQERATFAYIGEYYSKNGLAGFNDDGYCTEGINYFNYGFGHYILLRENIMLATNGKLDLFEDPKVKNIVWYPVKMEIINGVYPTVSDSPQKVKPDPKIMSYLNKSMNMGLSSLDGISFDASTSDIMLSVISESDIESSNASNKRKEEKEACSFFDKTLVMVSRPGNNAHCNIGATFKGGNNDEHHNHNDVGSYTIVSGKEIMSGDPGLIPYTSNIFDSQYRYTYKTLSSYGHPLPLIAEKPQVPGREAEAKLVKKETTADSDILVLDVASCYDVATLKNLTREFIYNRKGKGYVSITDNYLFDSTEMFETAIITRAKWKQVSGNTLLLELGNEKMKVVIQSDNQFIIKSEKIDEGGVPYMRIGIAMENKTLSGSVNIKFSPK